MSEECLTEAEQRAISMQRVHNEFLLKLRADFPVLWRPPTGDEPDVSIDVGKGWFPLVYQLSKELSTFISTFEQLLPLELVPHVTHVKEKFGSMRFYVSLNESYKLPAELSEKFDNIIYNAELKSQQTCEECCGDAKIRNTWPQTDISFGWLKTLCEKCWHDEAMRRMKYGLGANHPAVIAWYKEQLSKEKK